MIRKRLLPAVAALLALPLTGAALPAASPSADARGVPSAASEAFPPAEAAQDGDPLRMWYTAPVED
ncbi:hypothetical protein [Microbacterium sp. gxy059]|uniref:hypothetical protein n=1 Tax=Microbacterium sp. gxy059 TaxID=2957199 RepID=UPI003D9735CE